MMTNTIHSDMPVFLGRHHAAGTVNFVNPEPKGVKPRRINAMCTVFFRIQVPY
jgi:hypothetical protein